MSRAGRSMLAFILVPPIPGMIFHLFYVGISTYAGSANAVMWLFALGALVGYFYAIPFGIPIHLFLLAHGWTGFGIYAAVGVVAFCCAQLIRFAFDAWSSAPIWSDEPFIGIVGDLLRAGAYGMFSSSLFWLIARPDRLDKLPTGAPVARAVASPMERADG